MAMDMNLICNTDLTMPGQVLHLQHNPSLLPPGWKVRVQARHEVAHAGGRVPDVPGR